ncbi:hypothetical protein QE152_g13594 [Popillia japonica]|uniref:ATR-interacting protein n=1 Tax=Popillia japonica TaxID=7064 RepID=A0AAW1L9G5_POPJA
MSKRSGNFSDTKYLLISSEMSKRSGNFSDTKCKKAKTENGNISQLLDDDLDEYLLLATQVCEENGTIDTQHNDISILPNYTIFEQQQRKDVCTSTQQNSSNRSIICSTFVQPCTSSSCRINTNLNGETETVLDLQIELRNLKEKYECKDGEATMLRTQLKETRFRSEQEHQQKIKEWIDKTNVQRKEINALRSQLDFKNLEIVNVKNTLLNISKAYKAIALQDGQHQPDGVYDPVIKRKSSKLQGISFKRHPFADDTAASVFVPGQLENFTSTLKCNINLDLLTEGEEYEILTRYRSITDFKHFTLDRMRYCVFVIIKNDFLHIKESYSHIDEILRITVSALTFLYNYLLIQEYQILAADRCQINEASPQQEVNVTIQNGSLSIYDSNSWFDKEIGVKARQTVSVIAELLPYISYLQQIFTCSIKHTNVDYLNCIKMILRTIDRIKKADITYGFLCSVTTLLIRVAQVKPCNYNNKHILDIFEELFLLKPCTKIIKQLLLCLQQNSIHSIFVQELCNSSSRTGDCILNIFLSAHLNKLVETEELTFKMMLNILQLISNFFVHNPSWLHYVVAAADQKSCDCICKINTLAVNIVFDIVNKSRRTRSLKSTPQDVAIFKSCVKIIHIMIFKYFDQTNKHLIVSQNKFILKYLCASLGDVINWKDFESEALYEMSTQDEISKIDSKDFDKVPIW